MEQEYDLDVEWRGLEIHPEFPSDGIPRRTYLGDRSRAATEGVLWLAAQAGLEMVLPEVIANSHAALAAAELARDRGVFPSFHRRLFEAYFQEGQNIGSTEVLVTLAREAGLDGAEVLAALAEHRYQARLDQALWEAQEQLITGVPTFLVAGQRIVGAQPYPVLSRAVEMAGAEKRKLKETEKNSLCLP